MTRASRRVRSMKGDQCAMCDHAQMFSQLMFVGQVSSLDAGVPWVVRGFVADERYGIQLEFTDVVGFDVVDRTR